MSETTDTHAAAVAVRPLLECLPSGRRTRRRVMKTRAIWRVCGRSAAAKREMHQSARPLTQVTIIGHERPPRIRPRPGRRAASGRIPFGAGARAGRGLGLAAVGRPVPGRRSLAARIRDRPRRRRDAVRGHGSGASIRTISARSSRPPIPAITAAIVSNANTGC